VGDINPYIPLAVALFGWSVMWYVIALINKRNDLADVAWGLGFVFLVWLAFYLSGGNQRALLVNALVTVWGLRLAWHIHTRNHGKPEDFRYAQWRKEWKHFYLRSFLQVFLLQGIFLFVTVWPVIFINLSVPEPFQWLDFTGVLVWLIGFYFESVGDYQLKQFKKNPANKGQIITTGLWRYTRHPNYFGEALQWWGLFIIALILPGGWVTVVGPIVITYLLRYVSGVPMLEAKYKGNAVFESYKKKTSIFFPMSPRV
jgi:steroid 5-alpha reductase family enzyme